MEQVNFYMYAARSTREFEPNIAKYRKKNPLKQGGPLDDPSSSNTKHGEGGGESSESDSDSDDDDESSSQMREQRLVFWEVGLRQDLFIFYSCFSLDLASN